jgi:hypothetical protein
MPSNHGGDLYDKAVIYLHLGDQESMFECLEKFVAQAGKEVLTVNFDRRFDGVRSHPRFQALIWKLGLEKR